MPVRVLLFNCMTKRDPRTLMAQLLTTLERRAPLSSTPLCFCCTGSAQHLLFLSHAPFFSPILLLSLFAGYPTFLAHSDPCPFQSLPIPIFAHSDPCPYRSLPFDPCAFRSLPIPILAHSDPCHPILAHSLSYPFAFPHLPIPIPSLTHSHSLTYPFPFPHLPIPIPSLTHSHSLTYPFPFPSFPIPFLSHSLPFPFPSFPMFFRAHSFPCPFLPLPIPSLAQSLPCPNSLSHSLPFSFPSFLIPFLSHSLPFSFPFFHIPFLAHFFILARSLPFSFPHSLPCSSDLSSSPLCPLPLLQLASPPSLHLFPLSSSPIPPSWNHDRDAEAK
ncbi:unnamed protein product [Closterium sp. NIES-54]